MWSFGISGGSAGIGGDIVARARQDVGRTEEGGNNRGAIVRESLRGTGYTEDAPWCAGAATNWINAAARGQFGRDIVQTTAGTATMMSDYRQNGAFSQFKGDLSNVKVGDTVFFRRDGGGHVAIVSGNSGGSLRLIEGNVSLGGGNADGQGVDGVREASFSIGDLQARNIIGFGHNEQRARAMGGKELDLGIRGGVEVSSKNLGDFSAQNFRGGGNNEGRSRG